LLHKFLKEELSQEVGLIIDPNDGMTPPLTYVPVGQGELSTTLSEFFDSMSSLQQSPNEVVSSKKTMRSKVFSPRSLFSQICAK